MKLQLAVSIFKRYDKKILGRITRADFRLIHEEYQKNGLIPKEIILATAYKQLDVINSGFILLNDLVPWFREVSCVSLQLTVNTI